jgi:putative addiction module killer protein
MGPIEVRQTDLFSDWLRGLSDGRAKTRIAARIRRLEQGNLGDCRSLGSGLVEMRVDYGPGYRVYFVRRGFVVVILLCGGDKGTQRQDIEKARRLAKVM